MDAVSKVSHVISTKRFNNRKRGRTQGTIDGIQTKQVTKKKTRHTEDSSSLLHDMNMNMNQDDSSLQHDVNIALSSLPVMKQEDFPPGDGMNEEQQLQSISSSHEAGHVHLETTNSAAV